MVQFAWFMYQQINSSRCICQSTIKKIIRAASRQVGYVQFVQPNLRENVGR